eukprot:14365226-Alexandrium_andersonii.AAC.1
MFGLEVRSSEHADKLAAIHVARVAPCCVSTWCCPFARRAQCSPAAYAARRLMQRMPRAGTRSAFSAPRPRAK